MNLEPPREDAARSNNRRLTVVLLRLVAVMLFVCGLFYWSLIVGIDPPRAFVSATVARFDLMPVWWKAAAPVLAVLYPVAGCGLWMTARWGPVVWALVVLVEAVMHVGYPQLFGSRALVLAVHLVALSAFAALRILAFRARRNRLRRR